MISDVWNILRYDLSHCPGRGRKRCLLEDQRGRGGRPPLRETGNLPRGVKSEYDYSTPVDKKKTLAPRVREKRGSQKVSSWWMMKETHCTPRPQDTGYVAGVVAPPTKVYFSRDEERQLMEGVRRFGRRWRHILSVYQFHKCRTALSLKDKYRSAQRLLEYHRDY